MKQRKEMNRSIGNNEPLIHGKERNVDAKLIPTRWHKLTEIAKDYRL